MEKFFSTVKCTSQGRAVVTHLRQAPGTEEPSKAYQVCGASRAARGLGNSHGAVAPWARRTSSFSPPVIALRLLGQYPPARCLAHAGKQKCGLHVFAHRRRNIELEEETKRSLGTWDKAVTLAETPRCAAVKPRRCISLGMSPTQYAAWAHFFFSLCVSPCDPQLDERVQPNAHRAPGAKNSAPGRRRVALLTTGFGC